MQNDENKKSNGFETNMKSELKKVVWPTGKQTWKSTWVTIGFVLLISIILIILNLCFDFLSDSYYNLVFGTGESHDHDHENEVVLSGDELSGDELSVPSGENSGEISGEVSGDSVEEAENEAEVE